jgi:hypothetical protein
MNLSVYLPQKLASELSHIAEHQNTTKNAIVKEALEEWIMHHNPRSKWPVNFFNFEPVKEAGDFSLYRKELGAPKEDIL